VFLSVVIKYCQIWGAVIERINLLDFFFDLAVNSYL